MEGRVPPSANAGNDDHLPLSPADTSNNNSNDIDIDEVKDYHHLQLSHPLPLPPGRETYIVQIPKDQIYRIPPPENALIVERHRKNTGDKSKKSRWCQMSGWMKICLIVLAIIVVLCIAITTMYFMFRPHEPKFSVTSVVVKNPEASETRNWRPKYGIELEAENRNGRASISYGQNGEVTMWYKGNNVANGKFPTLYQEPGEHSTDITVSLQGHGKGMPNDMYKGMNDSKRALPLEFKMHVQLKLKYGPIKSGNKKTEISCKVKLSSLTEDNKVLSQNCDTEFK